MLRSLVGITRQVYTCVVRPSLASVNHQAVSYFHESEEDRVTLGDNQHDKKNWRKHYPSDLTLKMKIDGTPYDELPVVNIKSSKNNVIISLCKASGDIIYSSSGGILGFRNTKGKTNLCAQTVGSHIGEKAVDLGLKNLRVKLNGIDGKRSSALLGLRTSGVRVVSITDVTKIPHNGCRPRKRPRK
ncbi:small ribosomal subunit protein uS11-like [Saccostrea echinata]|uniref:small ribosomal subunit protein uS11-like n=1 Tax=Saccostrea echinata TaxID=191078 RepID=UPI002A802EE9|nr:small ribosomal subunit protein uS11-like [Saccostrea echinata]